MSEKANAALHGMYKSAEVVGNYRYRLTRIWGITKLSRVVVMLNPSTADASLDDPTIRRVIGFAQRDGYGGVMVLNLFAYRATDPRELLTVADPIGARNDERLRFVLGLQRDLGLPVLAAWGANAPAARVAEVKALMPGVRWQHQGLTKGGHPRHPLYLPSDAPTQEWEA